MPGCEINKTMHIHNKKDAHDSIREAVESIFALHPDLDYIVKDDIRRFTYNCYERGYSEGFVAGAEYMDTKKDAI